MNIPRRNALILALLVGFASLFLRGPLSNSQERGLGIAQPGAERRVALVIGNGAYDEAPLKNPVNDANDMAQALVSLGFEVMHKQNLSQNDMKRAIREFGTKLRGSGVGLFYYAGHGAQVKGANYLIPVGAKAESEAEIEYEAVDAGFVLAQMETAGNAINIMILDACRNNPFARSFRSASRGLAQMDAPSGTLIAYATAPNSVASDGDGRNGVYTQELLKHMRTPNLSLEEVFKQVRVSVRNSTDGKQTPWESSSLTGNFVFTGTATGNRVDVPANALPAPQTLKPTCDKVFAWTEPYLSFNWTRVEGASTYTLELDCFKCSSHPTGWFSQLKKPWAIREGIGLRSTIYTGRDLYDQLKRERPLAFRWRVWAVDPESVNGVKSPWCQIAFAGVPPNEQPISRPKP